MWTILLHDEAIIKIDKLKAQLPAYISEFITVKTADEYSPATLLEYLKNFHQFCQWLINQKKVSASITADISVGELDKITLRDATEYKSYLLSRHKMNTKRVDQNGQALPSNELLAKPTIQRHITALKVIFKYLAKSANNHQNKPFLSHNIMEDLSNVTQRQTLQARADAIEDKLFLGDESQAYLDFIENIYPQNLTPRALLFHKRDLERNLALNALMLASGLRLSEVVGINLDDLDFENNRVSVLRKGSKKDSVRIAAFAMEYLDRYRQIRDSRYHPDKYEKAFFLTLTKGHSQRITGSAIEKMVAKYSKEFKVRVTPHKLRHTLATRLYQETNNLVLTAQQLGHSSTTTTTLYTHINNDAASDALNRL
ncbi:site-specific tyrosine recombinase XerS [Ligilactobacillus equi DSM 15833 = JCM 10991]|uniref:Site-specific tyrosine recombinase XerS n=1 Tax=Ligilactobacillus equi DSM 15833 = JCM 10991 TaxID=1423740 RepID=A0A0R1TH66_9LACO|nr:tyrosine recombinase XerS [Ligilactobacillus equi]KRL80454.1 site-specific tyrosine recombinase XerS [Ligilactobacillus equi DSM 15833 = JCM 10991]